MHHKRQFDNQLLVSAGISPATVAGSPALCAALVAPPPMEKSATIARRQGIWQETAVRQLCATTVVEGGKCARLGILQQFACGRLCRPMFSILATSGLRSLCIRSGKPLTAEYLTAQRGHSVGNQSSRRCPRIWPTAIVAMLLLFCHRGCQKRAVR
jgi:hypothetical protein